MQQYIRHSKTAKHRNRITDNEWETLSVIKNPELNKHRRLFLGEPGSKKWKEYYAGLLKTKRALFNEESLQDKEEKIERLTKRNTRKNIVGGDGGDDLVDILKKVVNAMGGNKSTPNDTQFEVAAAVAAAANGNQDNTLNKQVTAAANGNQDNTPNKQVTAADKGKIKLEEKFNKIFSEYSESILELVKIAEKYKIIVPKSLENQTDNDIKKINIQNCNADTVREYIDLCFDVSLIINEKQQKLDEKLKIAQNKYNIMDNKFKILNANEEYENAKEEFENAKEYENAKEEFNNEFMNKINYKIINMLLLVFNDYLKTQKPKTNTPVNSKNFTKNTPISSNNDNNQQNNECNITFGWFKDLFNDAKMIELLEFSQEQEITPPNSFLDKDKQFIPENVFESIKYNKKCNAEFIKIEFIPFFLQVYVKLIENIKGGGGGGVPNALETKPTVKENNNSNNGVKPATIKPNTKPTANPVVINATPADSTNSSSAEVAAEIIKQSGGAKDYDEDEEEQNRLRELLLFNIEVLRTLNMYANPMFFDDLYYYYYFLSLDKIFPNIDSFFRLLSPSDSESGSGEKSKQQMNLRNSKTNVKMRLYEQFPNYVNQNPTNKNKDGKHYGYEIDEIRKDDDPSNFDLFLNLVQLKPEFNYMNPVVAEVEKDFLFNEIPVDEAKTDQVIAKAQVVNTGQKGGDFGFGLATSTYTYLDDAPLARKLEDVFKDEHATYDGNVHMCIYSLDKSCDFDGNGPTPFLKFIATKSGGDKWGFPSFHYTSLQDPDENDASFKCELFDHLMKTLEIHLCSETRGGGDIPPVKQEQPPLDDSTGKPEPTPLDDSTGKPEQTPIDDSNGKPDPEPKPLDDSTGKPDPEPTPLDDSTGQPDPTPLDDSTGKPDPEPTPLDDSTGKPEQKHLAKEKCAQIESSLDSMFIGIATIPDRGTRAGIEGLTREDLSSKVNVREEINGTPQLFAFLNYDFLETIVQTPENQAQTDLLFCRNADAKIYPITDSNLESPLKWAIVDELLFEKKIMGEEVDPAIFDGFSKHHNLWNIEDENHNYIRFPFSVFAVEIDDTNKFKTITVEKSEEEHPVVQIDHYGTGTMVDEYGPRYCFTISPLDAINPRRYAMFAWNARYIITDETQSEPNQDTPTETGGTIFLDSHPLKLELDDDDDATSGEPDSAKLNDAIANEKLEFPTIYTITQNEYTDKPVITWGILNETQFVQL